jgi:tRNA pseudouridine38-40 synthase
MRTIKLTLAYDGTAYAGWQVQPHKPSIQGAVESAIQEITSQHARVLASGRTDAGVHALGQVAAFRTDSKLPPDVLQRAINALLPPDIAVLDAAEVDPSFHPIRDAVRKRYRYTIHDGPVRDVFDRRYSWHYAHRLDAEAMRRAAQALLGKHDFSAFETAGAPRKSSVRTITNTSVRRSRDCCFSSPDLRDLRAFAVEETDATSDFLLLEVEADGFLYNMVRAIVGTLVEVGRGAESESWVADVLAAADRRRAGPTAPPEGLCLVRVDYENASLADR